MLPADMDVRSVNPALQSRLEPFDGIDASAGDGVAIFLCFVPNGHVLIAVVVQVFIATKFVGADLRAGQDVIVDHKVHSGLVAPRDNTSDQLALRSRKPTTQVLLAL